ncbi:hypothetical protein BC828DRAFT_388097 [Blastocladiella britannica]|nr:hypothetical protein BC828DRAFT_388097 [Blastocladiella britannica]
MDFLCLPDDVLSRILWSALYSRIDSSDPAVAFHSLALAHPTLMKLALYDRLASRPMGILRAGCTPLKTNAINAHHATVAVVVNVASKPWFHMSQSQFDGDENAFPTSHRPAMTPSFEPLRQDVSREALAWVFLSRCIGSHTTTFRAEVIPSRDGGGAPTLSRHFVRCISLLATMQTMRNGCTLLQLDLSHFSACKPAAIRHLLLNLDASAFPLRRLQVQLVHRAAGTRSLALPWLPTPPVLGGTVLSAPPASGALQGSVRACSGCSDHRVQFAHPVAGHAGCMHCRSSDATKRCGACHPLVMCWQCGPAAACCSSCWQGPPMGWTLYVRSSAVCASARHRSLRRVDSRWSDMVGDDDTDLEDGAGWVCRPCAAQLRSINWECDACSLLQDPLLAFP